MAGGIPAGTPPPLGSIGIMGKIAVKSMWLNILRAKYSKHLAYGWLLRLIIFQAKPVKYWIYRSC